VNFVERVLIDFSLPNIANEPGVPFGARRDLVFLDLIPVKSLRVCRDFFVTPGLRRFLITLLFLLDRTLLFLVADFFGLADTILTLFALMIVLFFLLARRARFALSFAIFAKALRARS
jgi:hypothetical protein